MKPLDKILRDRSGATITDLATIDLNHRDHFGRRTGQETLVGNEEVSTGVQRWKPVPGNGLVQTATPTAIHAATEEAERAQLSC